MARRGNLKIFDRFSWYTPSVSGILIIALLFLLGALLGNVVAFFCGTILGNSKPETLTVISYPVMFIPVMMYASIKSRNASMNKSGTKLNSANFNGGNIAPYALLAAAATLATAFCVDAVMSIMPAMPEWLENMMKSMTQGNLWINFICVSIFAPFFEEWLCRGMVLRGLLGNRVAPIWAIVISAVFFAVIHLNPWQAIPAFLLGCLFGYIYYKTGSLVLTMIMHFANNTFSLIIYQVDGLKDYDSFMQILPGAGYWIVFAACALLLILIIRVFHRIPLSRPEGNLDPVPSIFNSLDC